VEFQGNTSEAMAVARERDDFRLLSKQLDEHVKPFDPASWRSPADAMAREFYAWAPGQGSEMS
jgi:hypothetical protein